MNVRTSKQQYVGVYSVIAIDINSADRLAVKHLFYRLRYRSTAQHCCDDDQQINGKPEILTPCRSETPENFISLQIL